MNAVNVAGESEQFSHLHCCSRGFKPGISQPNAHCPMWAFFRPNFEQNLIVIILITLELHCSLISIC